MSDKDKAIQLGLLPNMNTPVSKLRQRQRPINNDVAARTQDRILQHDSSEVNEDAQSDPNTVTTHSPTWERSQEFIIRAGGRDVRVNFKAFYFSAFSSSKGYHHFEFYGHISSTGYRSDFLQVEQAVSSWLSPTAYAQQRAQELHAELLKQQRQQQATKRRAKEVKRRLDKNSVVG